MKPTAFLYLSALILIMAFPAAALSQQAAEAQTGQKIYTRANEDKGLLRGTITAETGEAIDGAVLTVDGTENEVRTDAAGRYEMELPSGERTIVIEHPEYNAKTMDVTISSKKSVTRDVELSGMQMLQMEEVKVTATHMKGSLPAFMKEERSSPDVVDALSAEQMGRAGDTYVADGLKRVTGLTLVEDKYVYVRGLGERYSSVLLNGARLSSTDPTRRVMELDFIPGEVLDGIVVQKSYSPDLPAAFGGGTILLEPKSYPESFLLKLSASTGYRTDTTFEDGKTYDGGDTDFLGIDDGTRDLPAAAPSRANWGSASSKVLEDIGESFPQAYAVEEETVPPDTDFSGSVGNQFRPGNGTNRFGYLASVRYSRNWQLNDQQWRNFDSEGDVIHDYELDWSDQQINTGFFLNLGADLGGNHELRSTTMLLRDTLDTTRIRQGYFSDWDQQIRETNLTWLERQTVSQQISGFHQFPGFYDLGLDWQYTFSQGDRREPDQRSYTQVWRDDQWTLPLEQDARNSRTWSDMTDTTNDFSFDVELPADLLEQTRFQTGFKLVDKSRDFDMRRFTFTPQKFSSGFDQSILDQPVEAVFSDPHINPDEFVISEFTRPSDEYAADHRTTGYYVMMDSRITPRFGMTAGLRHESSDMKVQSYDQHGTRYDAKLDVNDFFPAVSGTWFVGSGDETKLRLAYSQTTNRPDFKELSRAEYTDPVTGLLVIGNPELEQADIDSIDMRLEHFFSPYENVAVSLFYKKFDNPIEKIRKAAIIQTSGFINSDEADLYGVEIEALKYLDFINVAGIKDCFVGGNFALIESEVQIPRAEKEILTNDNRSLQGQSDWIVNFNLGYENNNNGMFATLLYNISGERISELGTFGRDDIYQQPVSRLDFVYRQKVVKNWRLKFEAENLLDPTIEFEQDGKVSRRYAEGRKFAFGVDYTF